MHITKNNTVITGMLVITYMTFRIWIRISQANLIEFGYGYGC